MNKDKKYFDSSTLQVVDKDAIPHIPEGNLVRCWDFAATKPNENNTDPDWTVGMLMGKDEKGVFYILDVVRFRENPADVKDRFINTTELDGVKTSVYLPIDPGSAGKHVVDDYIRTLSGFDITAEKMSGSKEVRAKPAASQAAINNIKVVRAEWNHAVLSEFQDFPLGNHDDCVDTLSDCIQALTKRKTTDWDKLG